MPRPQGWRDLVPGLLALAVGAALVAAVLLFARVGDIHGSKLRLFATVRQARDLSAGSEVWLGGERIGIVDDVRFLPATSDTTERVLLELKVQAKYREFIRRDASVRIRPGGNLVGAPVVAIGIGSPSSPQVAERDTLTNSGEQDMDRVRVDVRAATTQIPAVLANMQVLTTQLRSAYGVLSALGLGDRVRPSGARSEVSQAMSSFRQLGARLGTQSRDGRVSGAMGYAREAMARADSVRALLAGAPNTSLGRFRRDSTLVREIAAIRAELDVASAALASPRGTAGRLQRDSALVDEIERSRVLMDRLFTDLKRNPLRYLAF